MSRTRPTTPPPSGWCARRPPRPRRPRAPRASRRAAGRRRGRPSNGQFPDLTALLALVDAARGALPPELAWALVDALRELLIALRAVLDYSIERLDRPGPSEPRVEDIPIS